MICPGVSPDNSGMANVTDDEIQIYGVYQVAKLLSRSGRTIRRWMNEGRIIAWRNGNRWETSRSEIIRFVCKLKERHNNDKD